MEHNQRPESKDCSLSKENIPLADGFGSGNMEPKLQTPFKQQENILSADSPGSTASNVSFKGDCSKDLFIGLKDEQFSPLPKLQTPFKQQENIPSADSPWSTASNTSFKSDCSRDLFSGFKDEQFSPIPEPQRPDCPDVRMSERDNMSRYATPILEQQRPDYPYFRTFEENIQSPGIDTPHPEPQRPDCPDVRVSEGYNMSQYSTPMKKKRRGSCRTLFT